MVDVAAHIADVPAVIAAVAVAAAVSLCSAVFATH